MVKINLYIDELLHDYYCVVVPGLGGFVANYTSAQPDPAKQYFNPPHKNIFFNKNLTSNDGLLCRTVALKENLTFEEANSRILNTVFLVKDLLAKGEKVEFNHLGTLSLDEEDNYRFNLLSKENFLTEAFGLAGLYIHPLTKEKTISVREKTFADRPAVAIEKKQGRTRRYWPAIVAAPVLFVMVCIPLKWDVVPGLHLSEASWNPFHNNTVSTTPARQLKGASPASSIAFTLPVSNTPAIEQTEATTENFYIIAGCFRSKRNAEKLIRTLTKKGKKADIIGQNEQGLYRVAVSSFANKEQAENALIGAKAEFPEAWVLSN